MWALCVGTATTFQIQTEYSLAPDIERETTQTCSCRGGSHECTYRSKPGTASFSISSHIISDINMQSTLCKLRAVGLALGYHRG